MLRIMRSRRWILLFLFSIAFSALCVRLGLWQWHRMEHKKHIEALIRLHLSAKPVLLSGVLQSGQEVTPDQEWTRVTATGRFDGDHQVTVKFTTREGAPGADVVTPLVLRDGTAVLINRGWMPTHNTDVRPTNVPRPPQGTVTIEGWLRPDNHAGSHAVVPVDGQVRAVSSHGLRHYVGKPLVHGFINQQSLRATGLQPEPRPKVGHALNFFYAWQWWFFSGLALLGPFWFARAEARDQARAIRSA